MPARPDSKNLAISRAASGEISERPPPSLGPPPLVQGPSKSTVRSARKLPQERLRAIDAERAVAEWASLVGDLDRAVPSEGDPVEWRVHDRTHVEFAIDYPLQERAVTYTWEAYFFVPESFRLQAETYDKKEIYDDLMSYVRLAVPEVAFGDLARLDDGAQLAKIRAALRACDGAENGTPEASTAMRELRLFACFVRASGVAAMRKLQASALLGDGAGVRAPSSTFGATCGAVASSFRSVIGEAAAGLRLPEEVRTAMRWSDEDISLVLETLCADAGIVIGRMAGNDSAAGDAAAHLAARAVAEARHRVASGMSSVGASDATERDIERLEFRRHVLKRFAGSVLWLSLEMKAGSTWVVHIPYALGAAFAMIFAIVASTRLVSSAESFTRYLVAGTAAYAVKDRLKALLQEVFSRWIEKRFPDRRWVIRDHERSRNVGRVHERAGFLPFRRLPPGVLAARRLTREHALEEHARPERVLWHEKQVEVEPATVAPGFPMLTEIFRLNLRQWLENTDDPNRKIIFADPRDARIYSASARRVYNINVVYRLRRSEAQEAWHRLRVVVSRKGIERIDSIR